MKNINKWEPQRFRLDKKGKIIGPYIDKIIGYAYKNAIENFAKGKLTDLGCDIVPYYHFYKNLVTENICIDIRNDKNEISFLDFEADLNEPLNLESNSFDTILCSDVIEHIRKPYDLFSEITRVLKPDGHLIIGVPFLYCVHDSPHDYHRYTHFMLREFCRINNLEVIKLEAYGGIPEILFDLTYKAVNYYNFPMKKIICNILEGTGKLFYKIKPVRKFSDLSKPIFPMGYILVAKKI
ncbi:MAG: class I SAM-dependent methyltransferase [Bacteroidales bacterium]|jgi:SAM-dependent methyltransferase